MIVRMASQIPIFSIMVSPLLSISIGFASVLCSVRIKVDMSIFRMPSFASLGSEPPNAVAIPSRKISENTNETTEKTISPTTVASDIFKKSFIYKQLNVYASAHTLQN